MASRRKGRRLAVQALYSWDVGKADLSSVLQFPWSNTAEDDLGFSRLIVQGTVENIDEIDSLLIAQLEHWDMERLAKVDLAILRMAAYCLRYEPTIPAHVTIDEAVELAKELSTDEAYRFVNGVLDSVRRSLAV